MSQNLHHATITLERTYPATIERLFSEFADPKARAKWSVSANDALVYDEADFREGGRDVFRCGSADDLKFLGTTAYHVIVRNQCVITTETLTEGKVHLAVALNTLEFEPAAAGATIKITVQMISFVGPGIVAGYESGNKGALEGLAQHLASIG
jgi:uncharacterized protein YndB with AHSA1/START domain